MTTPSPLDANAFARFSPLIERELRQRTTGGVHAGRIGHSSMTGMLEQAFVHLFGERTPQEQTRFFVFTAPLMRRLAIEQAGANGRLGDTEIRAAELERWLGRLEAFDPMSARMIDLHYFAGLSIDATAAALGISPQSVIRDMRFAKAWLQSRIHRPASP